jgi:hypothetical protein
MFQESLISQEEVRRSVSAARSEIAILELPLAE